MIRRVICFAFSAFLPCLSAVTSAGNAGNKAGGESASGGLRKTLGNDVYAPILINDVFNYYANNGDGSFNPYSPGTEGFEYPKGSEGHIDFEDGILWGGFHGGMLKVGGSSYNHGLQAGRIVLPGMNGAPPVADNAADPANRLYRVRPDVNPSMPFDYNMETKLDTEEVRLTGRYQPVTAAQIYRQYIDDWNQWPAAQGAPFKDVNGNGIYDPGVDIPGIPGAGQTLWYAANDLDSNRTLNLYGSPPIGIEMQRTVWAYRQPGALGSTIFTCTRIINKSGARIDSMFISQFADPDLGGTQGASDNYCGCDTARDLGYVYNGTDCSPDPAYGCAPPAGGYILLGGPSVAGAPGDSARFGPGIRPGRKNIRMSSFTYFIGGSTYYSDPILRDHRGTIQIYNYMNGRIGSTGSPFIDPTTGLPTKFPLSGDPISKSGWIELPPAGDRRIMLTAGPLTMAASDTQELVVASTAARATDKPSGIALLRYTADWVRQVYRTGLLVGGPPSPPVVQTAGLEGEIVLSWGDPTASAATEGPILSGYAFQGYNVYQLPGPAFQNAKLLAVYDLVDGIGRIKDYVFDPATGDIVLKIVRFGRDSGVRRFYETRADSLGRTQLLNGTAYYFAVTAYNYNPDPLAYPRTFESDPAILSVTPQSTKPGTRYAGNYGDTVKPVMQTVLPGGSRTDGTVSPVIVDPTALNGHAYRLTFDTSRGGTLWTLTDTTSRMVRVSGQPLSYQGVIDGMLITVEHPLQGMRGYLGGTDWAASGGYLGLEGFSGSIGNAHDHWYSGGVDYNRLRNVLLRQVLSDKSGTIQNIEDLNVSFAYRYVANASLPAAHPEFAPFILNRGPGFAFQDFNHNVPLAAYDIEASPPRRLAVGYLENNAGGGLVDGRYWPPVAYADNVDSTGPREWFFIFDHDYSASPDPSLEVDIRSAHTPLMWYGTMDRSYVGSLGSADSLVILASHLITPANAFTFSAPSNVVGNPGIARLDVTRITVFPNPYFAFNPQETDRHNRFVTFYHLPQKAIIRIYDIAGWLVRTIVKDDPDQFTRWDLLTQGGYIVASGMYIVYIELPEIGATKILKLGIISRVVIPDRY